MADRIEYLTAEQVMEHLQIGRTFVYEQARLYLTSDGAEGLPCRRFGRLLRFPLHEIEAHGCPSGGAQVVDLETRRRATPSATKPTPSKRARTPTRTTGNDQSSLPFTD